MRKDHTSAGLRIEGEIELKSKIGIGESVRVGSCVKIKPGASVLMDFRGWVWPNLPRAKANTILVIDEIGFNEACLRGPGFGHKPTLSIESYGRGVVSVKLEDLIPVYFSAEGKVK